MGHQQETRVPDSELDFDDELIYRWRGSLFTGIGYEDTPGGGVSEINYRYGVQEGPARDWYPSGTLQAESHFRENVPHGVAREYAEDGTLIQEAFHEYGILIERREISAAGEMVTTFLIDPDSSTYPMLERYRREKGWPNSSE
jgi:antitoxin component YwqK of YwqJK toxin-antitoxin module